MDECNLTAKDIKQLLGKRHVKDIFYKEVNTGFTDSEVRRMDAWALQKSYTAPLTYGYEVKISRSDFLHDSKMQSYLGFCNEMYLVTTPGVVCDANELPENFGWLEVQKFGDDYRLRTKRKAPYRNTDIPVSFWRALVINKGFPDIDTNPFMENQYHARSAKEWLEKKSEWLQIGSALGEEIARYRRDKKGTEKMNRVLLELYRFLCRKIPISDNNLSEEHLAQLEEYINEKLTVEDISRTAARLECLAADLKGYGKE